MKFTPLLSVLPLLALAAPTLAAPASAHGNRVARHVAPVAQAQNVHLVRRGKAPKKCGVPDPVDDEDDEAPAAEGHTEAPAPEAQQPAPEAEKAAEEKPAEEKPAEETPAEEWKEEHPEGFHDEGKHPEEQQKPEQEQANPNFGHNLNAAPVPEHKEEHNEWKPEEEHKAEWKPEEEHKEEWKAPEEEHKEEWKPEENHNNNNNGGGHSGEVFSGKATHYNVLNPWENEGYPAGTVACDNDRKFNNGEIFVAMNWRQYDAGGGRNGVCWRQVRITDESTGNSQVAQVVDRCGGGAHGSQWETCKWGDLDLSEPLWKALHGDNNRGVFDIKWSWV
ncbi:Zinc metalloprotease ZmpB [Vanrija pseudolonga]|uniref:Zinc metalloprotease ZmpB n=1 Tax=Vanrija pseudolonga TaxID=143232 RepID=A0AAF0Y9G4_9TREE|nr:Zinc metalloprotease ZmpB [Vanrija pseudolonga]